MTVAEVHPSPDTEQLDGRMKLRTPRYHNTISLPGKDSLLS